MANHDAPPGYLEDYNRSGSGKNAEIGILLIHGFTSSPSSMRPWAEYLNALGYTVRTPRLAGHGRKAEDLNKVKWQQWPEKLEVEFAELRKECRKVFICGLSMGGGLTLNLTADHNDEISGIILVNPWIHIKGAGRLFTYLRSRIQKMQYSPGNDIKKPNTKDFTYDHLPYVGLHEAAKMLYASRKKLSKIKVPVLLFHSVEDHVLPVSNTEIILNEISSNQKQRIELVDSYHVATLDNEKELVFTNSVTFIESLR